MIRIRYFARLREQLAIESEELQAGPEIRDLATLIGMLIERGGVWADLFDAGQQPVLMAVNQEVANQQTPVNDGDEVAFFPPVTGG